MFPVVEASGQGLVLEHLGRDERSRLVQRQWVELVDDDHEYSGQNGRIDLEDGVKVWFAQGGTFRLGRTGSSPSADGCESHLVLWKMQLHLPGFFS